MAEKISNNLVIAIAIAVLVILLFGWTGMMGFGGMGGMMGNLWYGFGGMWMFGFLFMSLIVIALVLFIIWLIKQLQDKK